MIDYYLYYLPITVTSFWEIAPALQTHKSVILDTLHFQLPVRIDPKDSWTQFQCVCVCVCEYICVPVCMCSHVYVFMCAHTNFPIPIRNSWMPARCQRFQLSSDTIYLEIESDSTGTGLCPTRPPSTSDQSQAQVATCTSHWLAINQRFPWSPLGVQLIC